jgi:hypothetical protein
MELTLFTYKFQKDYKSAANQRTSVARQPTHTSLEIMEAVSSVGSMLMLN